MKAFELGAVPIHLAWIQFGPWACPDEKGFGAASNFNINATFRYGISVNPKIGKRYMNELADRREFYNDSVNNYNIRIQSFPDMIVARMMAYKAEKMFEVSAADMKDVKVEF